MCFHCILPWLVLWISMLRVMHCQKTKPELGHCRTKSYCILFFDIECVSFFCQEIAVLKGRNWVLKGRLLMIAMLKSSPEGDLFGRNRSFFFINASLQVLKIPSSSLRTSPQDIIYKLNSTSSSFSDFCTVNCSSTMMVQTTVYLSRRKTTNCRSNLTSPFTSTSGGGYQMFTFLLVHLLYSRLSFPSCPLVRYINVSCLDRCCSSCFKLHTILVCAVSVSHVSSFFSYP